MYFRALLPQLPAETARGEGGRCRMSLAHDDALELATSCGLPASSPLLL